MNATLKRAFFLPLLLLAVAVPSARAQMFSVACGEVDDVAKATNYSLYYESFKNEAYKDAMPYLRWTIACAPLYPSNNDKNFRRLMEVYEHMAEQAADPAAKAAYYDSVLVTYDAMLPVLEAGGISVNKALANVEKGRFLQAHAETMPQRQPEVAQLYREAYQMQPDSTDAYTIQYLFADLLQNNDRSGALSFAKEVKERFPSDTTLTNYVDRFMGQLFANDEEKYAFYQEQLAADPNNEEALNEVIDLAIKMRDTAKMEELEPQILARLEADPSVRMYRILAGIRAERDDVSGAIELFNKAIEASTDPDEQRDLYFNIGTYQHRAGNLGAARSAYNKALGLDPNYGRAILGIGDIIASCGSGSFEGRQVYWLATDYYARARERDPSVADEAAQRIGRIRGSYPSKEDLFFRNMSAGQGVSVTACGVTERTTVK